MWRLPFALMVLVIALSLGCAGESAEEPLEGIGSISTDNYANTTLEYYYHVPPHMSNGPQEPCPVLVLVPGLSGRGEQFVSQQFKEFAQKEGFLIVSPSFVWDSGNWDSQQSYQYPSVWSGEALLEIIDQFEARNNLSTSAMYLFGFSAGAQFALRFCLWNPAQCVACAAHGSG